MTYNKETRVEEMETELRDDKIREFKNEFDDGDFDTWVDENKEELITQFIDTHKMEWKDFCKDSWREHNERLN